MEFPKPPGAALTAPDDSKRLNEDELSYIFRTTLIPQHREDPNIIRFILEYVATRDIKEACRIVGINPRSGQALRNRKDIFKCIETIGQQSVFKYGIDPAAIVSKVNEIVEIDPIDLLNADGSYKKLHEIPGPARRAIKKMKVMNKFEKDPNGHPMVVGEILEIEFHDKLKASELVGRESELFKEKKVIEHDVTKNMSNLLLDSQSRAEQRNVIDVTPKKVGSSE